MEKFSRRIVLGEAAYPNNIGFAEMVQFYQVASPSRIKDMEAIIKNEDWDGFRTLIQKVTGVKLK